MLEQLAEGLWVIGAPKKLLGADMGMRATLVRLPSGAIWVHSPVPLTDGLASDVAALGPVRVLVGPNKFHHLYLRPWSEAFPEAEIWGAPGLPDKRKNLAFSGVLRGDPPACFEGAFELCHVGGMPAVEEVAFFHRDTRTLILTDLAFHVTEARGLMTRLVHTVNGTLGRFGPSRLLRSTIKDRSAFAESIERVRSWDFDRVTVTHGQVMQTGGREAFARAFADYQSAKSMSSSAPSSSR